MMSSNLSISRRRFVTNSLKSYWWLMLINAILYFLVGPMFLIMHFSGYNIDVYQSDRWQRMVDSWFYLDSFLGIYLLTMILGIVMGLVMFNFLHHKRQVNFYHALPITRKEHFLMRLGIGAVLVFIPLVVMILLMVAFGVGFGGSLSYLLPATMGHLGRTILFFFVCYGVTILAGQLTGNVLTHICMTMLLHFGLLLLFGCFLLLGGTFFNTFYISTQTEARLLCLSPITYLVNFLSDVQGYAAETPFMHMPINGAIGVSIVALAAIILAFVLYQYRPSETAGQPVVYKVLYQPLKWVILFLTATAGSVVFLETSGKMMMIFGCLLFIVLTQMVIEVILSKDFKAIGKNWQSALGFAVLYLALLGSMYYDVWGYDSYVPDAKDVQSVQISFSNLAEGYGFDRLENSSNLQEPEQIASVVAILEKVTDEKAYMKNSVLYSNHDLVDHEFSSNILVKYTMGNGRIISRNYYQTPVALYEEEFAQLYASQEFKQMLNSLIVDQGKVLYVGIDAMESEFLPYVGDESYRTFGEDSEERDIYGSQLREAFRQDLYDRSLDTLKRGAICILDLEVETDPVARRSDGIGYAVYAEDVNTLAMLDNMQADGRLIVLTPEKKAEMIQRVDIYRLSDDEEDDVRGLRYREDLGYIEKIGTKIGEVTDPAAILALLPDVVTSSQLSRSSSFVQVDYHYIAIAQIKDEFAATSDRDDDRIVMYYLKEHLPE